jgi:hypothetical protein
MENQVPVTYPNQYPPQQPPAYPPAQPSQYPPAYQQPQYPPPQQQPPYYPPPQQQPTAPPQANLTIDDFYDQPAASGKSIASWFQTPGQSLTGVVARAISKADIRPQTDMQTKQPRYFSDGRQMTTMTVPLLVAPSADFPDGRAAWIVSSGDRPDLEAAMEAAGCPPRTVPEAGARITITFTGLKQIPGFGVPKKVKQVTYQRPAGAGAGNGPGAPLRQEQAAPPVPGPSGQAAQDMVNGNGSYYQNNQPAMAQAAAPQPQFQQPYQQQPDPNLAYQQATGQPPFQQPAFGQPQADWNPYAQQPQVPPTPAPAAVPPASVSAAAPPAAAPSPSNGQPAAAQQYAVPGNLTPEQEARLRLLTGEQSG